MNKYLKPKNYIVKLKSWLQKPYSISYSQHGEDIILWHLCSSLGLKKPSYVDIGAFHPQKLSNTYLLYKHGSRGITIEPNKKVISLFNRIRPGDTNLALAIASTAGKEEYFVMDTPTLNTLSRVEAENYKKLGHKMIESYMVDTLPLSTIIQKYCDGNFPDILSLDTEGFDKQILETIDWTRSSPKIICVETAEYSKAYAHKKDTELIAWIEQKGYIIFADTYINTIFLRSDLNKDYDRE